jgi:FMN phosphatase YigB (HAD superfamily)
MTRTQPKVIFLDWYNTLSTSKFWGHWENDKHPYFEKFEKIQASFFGKIKPMIAPWMRGEYTSEEIVKEIAIDTKVPYKFLLNELIFSCKSMTFVSDELPEIIHKLRKQGKKVVVATDNMDSFTRWTVDAMNLNAMFDGVLSSYHIKSLKKEFDDGGNSLFFRKFLKENGIKPQEGILFDDSEDKEDRIQKFGIVYQRIKSSDHFLSQLKTFI